MPRGGPALRREGGPGDGPLRAAERHDVVDVLRALALLGILLVNVEFLASTVDDGWARPEFGGTLDLVARAAIVALVQLKAYLVFALLFGYGAAIMLRRAPDDRTFVRRWRRRMAALGVLGVLHAILLFVGDILLSYALLGLLLLPFRRASVRRLLVAALVTFAVGSLLIALLAALLALADPDTGASTSDAARVYAQGSFADVAGQRLEELPSVLLVLVFVQWPGAFAMFLLGLAAARTGVLARPAEARQLLRRGVRIALPIGLAGGVAAGLLAVAEPERSDGPTAALGLLVQSLTAPFLALGYVAVAALASTRAGWRGAAGVLQPRGRMSLTAYLAESLACSLIFAGYGLGHFGEVGPADAVLVCLALWLALASFAWLWFRRFALGPAEWVLRAVTYGRA
jgi:uncharacterized protein